MNFEKEEFEDIYEGKEELNIWFIKILKESKRIMLIRDNGKAVILDLELKSLVDESDVIFQKNSRIQLTWTDDNFDSFNFIESFENRQKAIRITVLENDIDYLDIKPIKIESFGAIETFE